MLTVVPFSKIKLGTCQLEIWLAIFKYKNRNYEDIPLDTVLSALQTYNQSTYNSNFDIDLRLSEGDSMLFDLMEQSTFFGAINFYLDYINFFIIREKRKQKIGGKFLYPIYPDQNAFPSEDLWYSISLLTECKIVIFLLLDNKLLARSYGEGPDIFLFYHKMNFWPIFFFEKDYVLLEFFMEDRRVSLDSILKDLVDLPKYQNSYDMGDHILEDDETALMSLEDELSKRMDQSPTPFENLFIISPDVEFDKMYSYMLNSDLMQTNSPSALLEAYDILHNIMLDKLEILNKLNLFPPHDFMKAFMKFRHNIFATICKIFMFAGRHVLGTDQSLKGYIESNKTPDLLIFSDEIILMDFTVGNRYDSVDFYKGGGNFELKYDNEARLFSQKYNKPCYPIIVPAILDNYNIDEIINILSKHQTVKSRDFYNIFEEFFNIANKDRFLINLNNAISQDFSIKTEFVVPGLLSYDRPKLNKIMNISADILSNLSESFEYLKNRIFKMLERKTKKVSLIYDLDINRIFVQEDKKGFRSVDILSEMQKFDPAYLLSIIKFKNYQGFVPHNKIQGNVPVTVKKEDFYVRRTQWDFNPINDRLWDETKIYVNLNYGEKKSISIDDMINIGENDKVHFPPDYFEKLCNMPLKPILDCKSEDMLANCKVDDNHISESVKEFVENLELKNKIDILNFKYSPKPTFLYPFVSSPLENCSFDEINKQMISLYLKFGTGNYTKEILSKAYHNQFCTVNKTPISDEIKKIKSELSEKNREYYNLTLNEDKRPTPYYQLSDEQKKVILPVKNRVRILQKQYRNSMGQTKGVMHERMIKLLCGKKSKIRNDFELEMSHFETQSSFKGLGLLEDQINFDFGLYLKFLMKRLIAKNFHNMKLEPLYNNVRQPGPEFLTDMKNFHQERFDFFYNKFFEGTLLQQLCDFNQRLSGFLFNESVKTYNRDYVKIDNLGFNNIIVIVRGGPKIYKNQRSRLFRVLFYIDDDDLLFTGYKENKSFFFKKVDSQYLVMTPWSQIHQDVLLDNHSLSYRTFMNLYTTYTRNSDDFKQDMPNLHLFPFILSLHNRRKTEEFMHNSRYLIVNPLGSNANIKGIIKGFANFNYTYLDSWLKYRIKVGYQDFATKIMSINRKRKSNIDILLAQISLKDLWLNEPILKAEHLTTFIYITYMMTKAPVNSSIEQANNLWGILEDIEEFDKLHNDVEGLTDLSLRSDVLQFDENIYKDDYKYDPIYSQYLGHHLASYLQNSSNNLEYHIAWERIKNQDLDSIANSNGLRGWNSKNFFNKKGYEIVYQQVDELTRDTDLVDTIGRYLDSDLVTSNTLINADKLTIPEEEYKDWLFHIVHKIQRGGSREIFCMDIKTKTKQNPLEKMFKMICKKLPNEYISIPSNKRHGLIHTDFYEKPVKNWVNKTIRWVLDCRRWAPHSIFQKYMHFIHGLSPILPTDFVNNFMNFAEGMFTKKFVTREHVISKLKNNERFAPYSKYIKVFEQMADGYIMTVKFSFVMGIFNYLSTLMHSANQIVASEVIRNNLLINGYGLVVLDAKCHSDDSVVSSYHEKEESVRVSVLLYDWLLKNANHMLSIKKSQVNHDVYLEFLSILYVFDRFLPVIPKFASTLPFKPSDAGYSSDLTFSITQSIEMLSQGGTFEEAFLIMKLTEKYIQRVYNIKVNLNLPFQFFGGIDSHPIELLYSGGMSDLIRFRKYEPDIFWKCVNYLVDSKMIDIEKAEINVNWDMGAMLGNRLYNQFAHLHNIIDKLNDKIPWVLNNCKLGNSRLNLLWYVNKLKDRKFYSSLVDEPSARRFSRIFGAGKYRDLLTLEGERVDVSKFSVIFNKIKDIPDLKKEPIEVFDNYMNFISKDIFLFYESVNNTSIMEIQTSNLKDKPVTFRTGESSLGNLNIGSTDYVAYTREYEGYKLLGKKTNPFRDVEKIKSHLSVLGIEEEKYSNDQLLYLLRKILREDSKEYRLISSVRGDKRRIENFTEVLSMLEYNSVKRKQIILKNKAASIVDWERKIVQGKVPKIVRDYIKCYWSCSLFTKYRVDNLDIYSKNPFDIEKQLANDLPLEWKLILVNSIDSEDKELVYVNYWSHWTKEQVKIMGKWYGSGDCYISLPEMFVKISVQNGIVNKVLIETDYSGDLPNSTSWYLNNFFRFSGISTEFANSEYGKIDEIYLGFKYKEGIYGIGRAKSFDVILMQSEFITNLKPNFVYKKMKRVKKYNNFLYTDDKDNEYKIDFFVPVEESFILDLNEYIDKEKLKENMGEEHLFKFIQQMSIEQVGFAKIDFDYLIDNIGRSLIFKVLRSSTHAIDLYKGMKPDYEIFMMALLEWKKTHDNFGFPTEAELVDYLKRKDLPPVPKKIYNLLTKLGHSSISDVDYENILFKLVNLDPEEREHFLLSNFPQLSNEDKIESLVLAIRSDRIFTACKVLGNRGSELLIPLILSISSMLNDNVIDSPILSNYRSRFGSLNNEYKPLSYYWEIISTRLLMNSANVNFVFSHKDQMQEKWLNIVRQFLDNNLLDKLNYYTSSHAILRTVEFKVDNDIFFNWIIDVLDSIFMSRFTRQNLTFKDKSRKLYGENGILNVFITSLRSHAIRMEQYCSNDIITLYRGKSKEKQTYKVSNSIPGVTDVEFLPLTPEAHDEFDCGYAYDDEISEYYEFDDTIPIPDVLYTFVGHLNLVTLTGLRGGAYTMIIGANSIDLNLLKAHGKKYFYVRNYEHTNFYKFLDTNCSYIFIVSKLGINAEIEGYRKLKDEEVLKKLKSSPFINDEIIVEGKKHTKSQVYSSALLRSKLETVDQYFSKISNLQIDKEIELAEKKLNLTHEAVVANEEFNKYEKELTKEIEKYQKVKENEIRKKEENSEKEKNKKEEKKEEQEETKEEENVESLTDFLNSSNISEMLGQFDMKVASLAKDKKLRSVRRSDIDFVPYSFKEPLKLLSDIQFKSEFETLFPGYWNKFVNHEILLTKKTKRFKIQFAELRIRQMPKFMREKYTKILMIVKFMLANMEECDYVGYEDSVFGSRIDELFDIEYEANEDEINLINDLAIVEGRGDIKLDLSFLF